MEKRWYYVEITTKKDFSDWQYCWCYRVHAETWRKAIEGAAERYARVHPEPGPQLIRVGEYTEEEIRAYPSMFVSKPEPASV